MNELFRKHAVLNSTRRIEGEVILVNPLSVRVVIALIALIVTATCAFAATATYARKETVVGWLTPDRGLLRVVARQGGLIASVFVKEGDAVEAGEPLAELVLSAELKGGDDSGEVLVSALAAEARATLSRLDAQKDRLRTDTDRVRAQLEALRGELDETARQLALQEARAELARAQLERAETMAGQGFLSQGDFEQRRSEALAFELALSDARSRALALEQTVAELEADLAAKPLELAAIDAEADAVRATLAQRRADAQARSVYIVSSPVSGRVAALPAHAAQALGPGGLVAVVVPHHSRLIGELYVPSRSAGFIRVDQEVRLHYQAFPHQRFGAGIGRIREVSDTVLSPSDVALPGLSLNEPVFRVRAELLNDYVEAYGERVPLQPGMLLNADIVVDRRSLWEWLLDPVYSAARR